MNTTAIIPAAGAGNRFGEKKQLKILGDQPVLIHSIRPFIESEKINEIIIASSRDDFDTVKDIIKEADFQKYIKVIFGGKTRHESVKLGLEASHNSSQLVCIHDAARPFITKDLIEKSIQACKNHDGVVVAQRSIDTIKKVEGSKIIKTIPREKVWRAQTPQVFSKAILNNVLKIKNYSNQDPSDEALLFEEGGYDIVVIEGPASNFKITTQEDWTFAETIFNSLSHD